MGYHIMKTNMEEEQEKIELWIISAQEKKRTWEKFELGKKKRIILGPCLFTCLSIILYFVPETIFKQDFKK